MFKQIDCKNIRETSQRVIAERTYASTRNLHTLFAGNLGPRSPLHQYGATERRSRRNKGISFGANGREQIGTRFSMSPLEELISVTRSNSQYNNNISQNSQHNKKRANDMGKQNLHRKRNRKQNKKKRQKVASNRQRIRTYPDMPQTLLPSTDTILADGTRTIDYKSELDRS